MLTVGAFDKEGFSARLRKLQGDLSDRAFATKVGISATSLNNYLNGQTPGVDKVVKIAAICEVSVSWLITGEDEDRGVANKPTAPIPRLDVRASAGFGASGDDGNMIDAVDFPIDFLRSAGVSPANARILTVAGDSMEPTLSSGDLLLVDISVKRIKSEALYVLVRDDDVYVKRAQRRLNGTVLITSDNERYKPEEFSEADADRLLVAGRVAWYGRSI